VSEVDRAIATALAALEAAPDGWLELPERRRLREAYGRWTPPYEPGGPDAGLLRRAALVVASARRALPVWEREFPDDRRPHGLVDAIMPGLRNERPDEQLSNAMRALRDDVDRLGADLERARPFYAGMAAVYAVSEAWDGDLDPDIYPLDTRDVDPDDLPVEALAAWALAGDDPDARRDFWRWYVTEAFPAAYAVSA
jgi:Immunity protein Imm5